MTVARYVGNSAEDKAVALALTPVSRETQARLESLVEELGRWQAVKNLVGPRTLETVWTRHIADSLQLLTYADELKTWLDLGSGAGFPGLVLAAALADDPRASVHLVESNSRKCAFLRHSARTTGAAATIHELRIEDAIPSFLGRVQVVTARALAPLSQLLAWTEPLLTTSAVGLFPKGRGAEGELTEAAKSWRFDADLLPSRTDSEARIVRIRSLGRR
jgi:16S rRNA (guanine527-N7)-methyltransferase